MVEELDYKEGMDRADQYPPEIWRTTDEEAEEDDPFAEEDQKDEPIAYTKDEEPSSWDASAFSDWGEEALPAKEGNGTDLEEPKKPEKKEEPEEQEEEQEAPKVENDEDGEESEVFVP